MYSPLGTVFSLLMASSRCMQCVLHVSDFFKLKCLKELRGACIIWLTRGYKDIFLTKMLKRTKTCMYNMAYKRL